LNFAIEGRARKGLLRGSLRVSNRLKIELSSFQATSTAGALSQKRRNEEDSSLQVARLREARSTAREGRNEIARSPISDSRIEMANIRNVESFVACGGFNSSPQFHARRASPGMPLKCQRMPGYCFSISSASLLNGLTVKKGCSDRGHIDQSRPAAICRLFSSNHPDAANCTAVLQHAGTRAIENKREIGQPFTPILRLSRLPSGSTGKKEAEIDTPPATLLKEEIVSSLTGQRESCTEFSPELRINIAAKRKNLLTRYRTIFEFRCFEIHDYHRNMLILERIGAISLACSLKLGGHAVFNEAEK